MNRRSWFKSALATIVLAVSDGIPKILADTKSSIPKWKKELDLELKQIIIEMYEQEKSKDLPIVELHI